MRRLVLPAVMSLSCLAALAGCGSSGSSSEPSATAITSPPAGFVVEAKYTDMCAAFDALVKSPQAAVLNDDSASQDQISSAMTTFAPQMTQFVSDYSSVMPADVAESFASVVSEINAVAGLNDESSFGDAAKAVEGLRNLASEGKNVDAFTSSACGTSLGL